MPFLVAIAVSCSNAPRRNISEWSAVAIIDGNNRTAQNTVRSALRKNHIPCFMEGSIGYAVMVPKNQLKQARRVLLENTELEHLVTLLENGRIPNSKMNWYVPTNGPIKP